MKAAKRPAKKKAESAQTTQPLRIIGGQWRGRKLTFPAVEGLRPTGDRVRETLFNWLAPLLPDALCLDLFAGSGALGLEALSRGARSATLVEKDPVAATQLRANLRTLGSDRGRVLNEDSLRWLKREPPTQPFDVVFVDPPFDLDLWQESIERLARPGWLARDATVYIESAPALEPVLPDNWQLHRDKTTGQVRYRLYFLGS